MIMRNFEISPANLLQYCGGRVGFAENLRPWFVLPYVSTVQMKFKTVRH